MQINLPAFENKKKIHGPGRFRGSAPYGKIPTEKEPIRTLEFSCQIITMFTFLESSVRLQLMLYHISNVNRSTTCNSFKYKFNVP